MGFDRVVALVGSDVAGDASFRWDVAGLRRAVARWSRVTSDPMPFRDRYLVVQPTLDQSRWKIWGQLTGDAGAIVDTVLSDRADSFPALPDGTREPAGARRADALVTVCLDADGSEGSGSSSREPSVTVFVDAVSDPAISAASVAAGPVIDAAALSAQVCEGTIEVTAITSDSTPLRYGRRQRAIPPRLRRYILFRDGGCVADGCDSRYRLQPHHVVPWSEGGRTDPENLATLCWFHHHVVIHRMGYRIDPTIPAFRRRFLPPGHHPP